MTSRILLSSQYKISSETDYTFSNTLNYTVPYKRISLKRAMIPIQGLYHESFFWLDSSDTQYSFELDGVYSGSEVAAAIQAGINVHDATMAVTYDSITNKLSYVSSVFFTIKSSLWTDKLVYVLGESSNSETKADTHTSSGQIDLSGPQWLLCETNFGPNNLYLNSKLYRGWIIPCSASPGQLLVYDDPGPTQVYDTKNGSDTYIPSTINIRITDSWGNVYYTEEVDISLEFEIS